MKTSTKSKLRGSRRQSPSVKGDIARAMFARWEKDHHDPQPISWNKFKATLEKDRLRDTPLFDK